MIQCSECSPRACRRSRGCLREARAKQICRRCPVREPCSSYAIAAGESFGVWGATTPRERRDRNGCGGGADTGRS
ncbi:WhiB family transcriptional regulator [Mycobacteroides abscessus]|uniref:WhiB family transcriptional regulator n=1 Tax=Mycobacteroides abscessus TaxID=36809 RepID=UPI0028BE1C09|nr:WhiB family transcriptional regulator [Mycobacteroides abscessus]